jgi:hypothetical protein
MMEMILYNSLVDMINELNLHDDVIYSFSNKEESTIYSTFNMI